MKKSVTVHQTLEDLARRHLGVASLSHVEKNEMYEVSVNQITTALKAALLHGEKVGYAHGIEESSLSCSNCGGESGSKPKFLGIFDLV
jgi:hypothetical protein